MARRIEYFGDPVLTLAQVAFQCRAELLTWEMLPWLIALSFVGGAMAYAILVGIVGAGHVRALYQRTDGSNEQQEQDAHCFSRARSLLILGCIERPLPINFA